MKSLCGKIYSRIIESRESHRHELLFRANCLGKEIAIVPMPSMLAAQRKGLARRSTNHRVNRATVLTKVIIAYVRLDDSPTPNVRDTACLVATQRSTCIGIMVNYRLVMKTTSRRAKRKATGAHKKLN